MTRRAYAKLKAESDSLDEYLAPMRQRGGVDARR